MPLVRLGFPNIVNPHKLVLYPKNQVVDGSSVVSTVNFGLLIKLVGQAVRLRLTKVLGHFRLA